MVIRIPLRDGKFTLIDDEDAERVLALNWILQHSRGYPYARHKKGRNGKWLELHRFILQPPPGMLVDHINGDTLDNRRSNLRVCTKKENTRNRRKNVGAHPYKGIARHRGRWTARIKCDGRGYHLGVFDTPEEAARAYDYAAPIFFGAFARLNFPEATS